MVRPQFAGQPNRGGGGPRRRRGGDDDDFGGKPKIEASTGAGAGSQYSKYRLTLEEIERDPLTKIAQEKWRGKAETALDDGLVQKIYREELTPHKAGSSYLPRRKRVMLLEVSQYLERYLWPHFTPDASPEHVLSIVTLCNEKFREGVSPWESMQVANADAFPAFFSSVLRLRDDPDRPLALFERVQHLQFLVVAFQSLESELVRPCALKLVSLPLWHHLSPGRLQLELHRRPQLSKIWSKLLKKEAKAAKDNKTHVALWDRLEATFLPGLLSDFFGTLRKASEAPPAEDGDGAEAEAEADTKGGAGSQRAGLVRYCERFLELAIDLLSQLPTRRFVHALMEDRAVLVRCKRAGLYAQSDGELFVQLTDLLQFYLAFDIDDHTGETRTEEEGVQDHYDRISQFQRLAFYHIPALKDLALANCGAVASRQSLSRHLAPLPAAELARVACRQLRLLSQDDPDAADADFLREVLLWHFEHKPSRKEQVNQMPLYPTEAVLFDEKQVPSTHWTGETCLALPKLNLQFLSYHDYLLRNFQLFRLESTYEIRDDIMDALARMRPQRDPSGRTGFTGWARMACPLRHFAITEVARPAVGENKPSSVIAVVKVDLGAFRPEIKREWDHEMRQFETMFLLSVRVPSAARAQELALAAEAARRTQSDVAELLARAQQLGLAAVRGCEVVEVRDEAGNLMNDFTGRVRPDERKPPVGTLRSITVQLDTAQYQMDVDRVAEQGAEDVYSTFNLLVRRHAKENNWASVLRSIRDLMNEECVLPAWLHDIFLGYGDPGAASYRHMEGRVRTVDFVDTFLDAKHVIDSFPGYHVTFSNQAPGAAQGVVAGADVDALPRPPYRITFPESDGPNPAVVGEDIAGGPIGDGPAPQIVVEAYRPPDPGPYPQDHVRRNPVRFTPMQVEVIRSGVQPGLTVVVGPPGTGKTDTATQIINCLYHTCPTERTLLVAHSNQALNDLFQKIVERDVPARYLLRLGMGEEELDTDLDFSRAGRVNAMLARRLELLGQVERLAAALGAPIDMAYSCETAGHFWLLHVLARWEKFTHACKRARGEGAAGKGSGGGADGADGYSGYVRDLFPFGKYFEDAPQPLFPGTSHEEDMRAAERCFRHLRAMFQELEETRPFELLKSQRDRVNYLTTKQAKIVAMTCTHAALKRHDFIRMGLQYDNLIMEEAAQVLEVETFIPMLLQPSQEGKSRLKRVVLIGDHNQLPPVVQNMAIQKYARMDQSLFTRFVRLGVPYLQLDAQGRSRPAIADLYTWRYRTLRNLDHVSTLPWFTAANPGLALTHQLINVPDVDGVGETEPMPYFFQNLGEAEYAVALYMYMRLLGYPAKRISILTTYNGQRALIRDVVERRCANHPAYGRPHKVVTVDKYQGQQNDYVILSLVRSKTVGHLRDVRRLVVALSRARLGLYIVGRADLFANCNELRPAFEQLMRGPRELRLVRNEAWAEDWPEKEGVRMQDQAPPESDVVSVGNLVQLQGIVSGLQSQWETENYGQTFAAMAAANAWGQMAMQGGVMQGGQGMVQGGMVQGGQMSAHGGMVQGGQMAVQGGPGEVAEGVAGPGAGDGGGAVQGGAQGGGGNGAAEAGADGAEGEGSGGAGKRGRGADGAEDANGEGQGGKKARGE